ncbi:hypothetical protein [Parabacteroides distasonis]|jgi:hypothetical protein|uniref:hypothetical protein n=1 Tax=Parabacteroides distasonis TaxID=823 RepID=UPI001F252971|nr:hypothetical protein [Parabacteroides distasonis]MCE9127474.1 hypothetical protein [Parabacteroides distasonis]MCE9132218.1 hypothetical protein [Parabacteroides distasonis]UVX84162.1 MAG: hypothetical protein [Bacteriophage sp.]DAK97804.1 MAG TPA: tail protein [Bacteriophage sp.]
MSKKKLTKHIWYGSDTVMSEGKLQAAPPPVAIDDGTKEWHLSGLTRGELFVNDYAGDPALFILASDNKVRRIGGQGSGSGGEGGGGDFSLAQGPGIEIKSDINNIYTISHKDTSSQESINKTNKKGIASVLLDDFGHVTGLDTCDILDLEDLDKRYLRKDINDEAAGEIIFDKKIGSSIFLDGMDGKGWEIKADGSGIMEALKVRSDIYAGNKIGSISFAPGFTGWGTEIDIPTATGTFDNIFVRKTFTAYEIVYSQIYGLGGNQIVSDINKIGRVERLSDRWRCYMDDMDGLMLMNLREGDGVRIQRRNGITSTKYLFGRCIGISSDYFDVAYPLIEGTGEPEAGDFAMRWGNDRDTTRQGLIYLTSADQGAPFIAVYDGITGVSTQDTLKAQLGNLSMIRTKNGTQLKGYGAYLNGIYIENSSIYLDNGMTVEQQFSVMNGELRSEIEGLKNDMSLESGNILVNSTFGKDTSYWVEANDIHLINVSGNLLWVGGSFYSDKRKVSDIYRDGSRNVLRIKDTYIFQRNDVMKVPELEESEEGHTFSFSLFYKVMRRGVLTVGFQGQELYESLTLEPSDEYVKLSKVGKWDGTGDFRIGFTGEILIYGVSLFNDRLADAVIKLETRILQTEEYIKLLATKDYVDSETGKIYEKYTGELSVMATEIAARVTHTEFDTETAAIRREVSSALTVQDGKISGISTDVNNIQNTIDTAGWINTTQGNALFAAKSLENGDNIISYINQTATTTTIKAERIDLVGAVTFSMFNTDLQSTINGKANSSALGDLAYEDYITKGMMSTALQSELNGKVSEGALGTLAYASSISKNDLAYSLLTEFNGKANSSSLKALAYLDKVEQAQLGATIISGGHIITSLIDTDAIYANMASIAGFTIEKNQLYGTTNNEYYGSYKMYMDSSRCEIGISDSNESTYKLSVGYNYRTTNDAGTASLFIKKSLAIRTMVEVPRTAIKVAVTNADDSNMVKLECESTRNDSGFMNFLYCEHGIREIQLGTKKFSNDSPGIWRTVLRMDLMPSVTQVNTESTSGTRYNVKWDSATGLLYIE